MREGSGTTTGKSHSSGHSRPWVGGGKTRRSARKNHSSVAFVQSSLSPLKIVIFALPPNNQKIHLDLFFVLIAVTPEKESRRVGL